MILLDTNVLSGLMRQRPDQALIGWLDKQPRTSIWTTSITLFEIHLGIQILDEGKRQSALLADFNRLQEEVIQQRVAYLDSAAAKHAANLLAARRKKGRMSEFRDTMIAGIAMATNATLATGNLKHFDDLTTPVINPWTA